MTTTRSPKTRLVVVLEGERAASNAHVHTLKFLLKHLLRSRSLRCVDAREEKTDEQEPRE